MAETYCIQLDDEELIQVREAASRERLTIDTYLHQAVRRDARMQNLEVRQFLERKLLLLREELGEITVFLQLLDRLEN
jgi:hypothetical protein